MSGFDLEWALGFLFGALFIVFCAAARFSGPYADRSYTTLNRYLVANGYYILPYLGVYYLLAALVLWAIEASAWSDLEATHIIETPAWVAVLTVLLLPRVPPLSRLERSFLEHARTIGGIPDEAMALRDKIRSANCGTDQQLEREIHYSLLRRGLDLGKRRAVPDDTLHAQWIRASVLAYHLERWSEDPRFAPFLRANARPLHNIVRRYDYLIFKSSRDVESIGDLNEMINDSSGKSGLWESLGSLVESEVYAGHTGVLHPIMSTSRMMIKSLRDDMEFFIKDAALLIARVVLQHRWTEKARVALLGEVGIRVEPTPRPRFGSFGLVFAVMLAAMFLALVVLETAGSAGGQERSMAIGLMIMVPLNFVVALFCAIYPKQYFAFANPSILGRPPYLFFVTAGLAAAVLAFVIGLAMRTLIYQSGEVALTEAYRNLPWLLIPLTVASVTAVLIQDGAGPAIVRRRRRWWDAGWFAAALTFAMVVVQLLLQATKQGYEINFAAIGLSVLIGAFLGLLIPARYRLTGDAPAASKAEPRMAALAR